MQSAAEHSKSNDSKARKLRLVRGPTCILDGRLSMREIPSQSREALEVRFISLASTCRVAWRWLMRHVSLHPSSFALPPGLRPRSNGHRRMPRQNRLHPSPSGKFVGVPWGRQAANHSITSSASCWRCKGTSRPSALAVCRLMTNSNLIGCMTGRSAGFSPLRIRPVYTPAWRYASV
jgi:hypothetical protein